MRMPQSATAPQRIMAVLAAGFNAAGRLSPSEPSPGPTLTASNRGSPSSRGLGGEVIDRLGPGHIDLAAETPPTVAELRTLFGNFLARTG